ncbi:sulfite exporter TauE/SafE family protein [Azospirillum rugosum]|uniref:Probable membrane transporter protein n=1 Tax=Azospirillum rugosum TaxID=416170 RepID=A0ABS4SMS5_9PROT|nr:sulfite exporter TauE/SafE family protein [Azospirillum rugosum]MBP2293840.1 putative membrane protein YfcA [Azospirillum rugosum]MDQ0526973.1 putative membrane protein YfcA [Azospirillum rugosum]
MQVYLPIAEMSVNALLVLGMGGLVGFLSGMFGVGGGFLMTPLLIFIGVPPAVAVGTQANQLVAASVSGVLAHWRRGNVDVKLGIVMLLGGMVGTVVGVWIFALLQRIGQIDVAITLAYVFFLGTIGAMMLVESSRALIRRRAPTAKRGKLHRHIWLHGLPLKMRFQRSKLYISALLPAGIGAVGGMLVAIMGIGGGFLLVPAMIYLLNMPTGLVAGTSLFQIIFTTAMATLLQAATNQTVDAMLALLLLVGGVVGAQFGTKAGGKLRGEQARLLLAALVVAVALKLAVDLVVEPDDLFTISTRIS